MAHIGRVLHCQSRVARGYLPPSCSESRVACRIQVVGSRGLVDLAIRGRYRQYRLEDYTVLDPLAVWLLVSGRLVGMRVIFMSSLAAIHLAPSSPRRFSGHSQPRLFLGSHTIAGRLFAPSRAQQSCAIRTSSRHIPQLRHFEICGKSIVAIGKMSRTDCFAILLAVALCSRSEPNKLLQATCEDARA